MSTTPGSASPVTPTPRPGPTNPWAAGGTLFAGVLLTVMGVFAIFEGIAGIAEDEVYQRVGDYVFKADLTTWGWIHLILGILVLITGFAILKGAEWGRITGIVLAALSAIAHFLWLPYQPIWALIAIAIAVFIIWALCTNHPEQETARQ
ncbi:hypothetical protein DEJ50_12105 [Streptomyces venezuelae]|uniref:DUF7144 domain-containing protein n=1 Tax=Streptomyces venezuelae TaxID=54571 RepID=A0A5P2D5M5_STRVZ|nr:hypothetical protein [Streptomyces venezuelae]QES48449.1 hypothetical protein DEJ50_12105 [Streptomyces venezuelae]